jgi:hypothetical protein
VVFATTEGMNMPLKRLSDVKQSDEMVSPGSMSKRVKLEKLGQETSARVSLLGRKAEMTIPYQSDVEENTFVTFEDRRFRIERAIVLGLKVQIRLVCTQVGKPS